MSAPMLAPPRALRIALPTLLLSLALAGCTASGPAPQDRVFYVFTAIRDFNETAVGVPHDTFSPDILVVNQGDHVTIHFYNTDDERHTFTVGAPYNLNRDIDGGGNDTIAFTAQQAGVFTFSCTLHGPTMFGQFIVQKA